jgi:hypothetical protein
MSDNKDQKSFDPFEVWRRMRDASMDAWANAMTLTSNTEAYARATGAMLDACLTASIPLRQIIENAMGQALQQYNMPSRADFISLADRLTQIETAIDDLDAKLDLPRQPRPVEAAAPRGGPEGD